MQDSRETPTTRARPYDESRSHARGIVLQKKQVMDRFKGNFKDHADGQGVRDIWATPTKEFEDGVVMVLEPKEKN